MSKSPFDPRDRELCIDGACIGLIGQNGQCRECGKPGASSVLDPRQRGLRDESEVADELEAHIIEGDVVAAPVGFDDRALCPDGACIGILDADGKCKECGTVEPSEARDKRLARHRETQVEVTPQGQGSAGSEEAAEPKDVATADGPDGSAEAQDEEEHGKEGHGKEMFDERQLCPDGACIGLIQADGRCGECGTPMA